MVIYSRSKVITAVIAVMLFYNTEWQYYHEMVINYSGKKFYNIGSSVEVRSTQARSVAVLITTPKSFIVPALVEIERYLEMEWFSITFSSIQLRASC